jgi:hypothetical protein
MNHLLDSEPHMGPWYGRGVPRVQYGDSGYCIGLRIPALSAVAIADVALGVVACQWWKAIKRTS